MPYAPRKREITLKTIIPAVLAVFVLVYACIQFWPKPEEEKPYQIFSLSPEKSKEILEKKAESTYLFSDYFFYGESLNVLHATYDVEKYDDISGKSIVLKDVCSDKEYAFVIGSSVDSGINLNVLEEGFYEIYVIEDLTEKKAIMKDNVVESIKTTLQKDIRHEVTLLASVDYFKKENIDVKENYVYLEVKETSLAEDEYDIAIDPAGMDRDFNPWQVNYGSEGNGLIECEETLKAAVLLKDALEKKGYKVLIVRDENEKNSYGEEGRLKSAYDAKSKYYLRLAFSSSEFGYEGFDIAYSAHSSNMFASQIIYYMNRNSDVNISSVYSLGQNKGVYRCTLLEGMDERVVYDSDLWIRESGGKATQAGKYSENAKDGTSFFAEDNIYGMNALDIRLGYLSSKEDATYWKKNKEAFMNDLADAIQSYINVE